MAVIDGIPGLEVTVEVDGEALKEYDCPPDKNAGIPDEDLQIVATGKIENNQVTLAVEPRPYIVKYIEAIPGSQFKFHVKRKKDFKYLSHSIGFEALVDGLWDTLNYEDESSDENSTWERTIDEFIFWSEGGKEEHRTFRFATLETGDFDNLTQGELEEQKKKTQRFGVLQIYCYHMLESSTSETFDLVEPPSIENDKVHEKALKGKSVDCIAEFHSTLTEAEEYNLCHYYDPKERPFAIFEFRYRSKQGLINEGVIPRPPTPSSDEIVRDMSEEELRRLARDFLERERANTIKNKIESPNRRGIKRKGSPMDDASFSARFKSRRLDNGHLEVDLTDD